MEKYFRTIGLTLILVLAACEDQIDVPVQTAPARLTVEASLDWEKGTDGSEQTIRLSTSTPFFDTTSNTAVSGAMVQVTNDTSGTVFVFSDQNNGDYTTSEFVPIIGQSYTLEIVYDGETYTATETLNAITDITQLMQSTEEGDSEDDLEVRVIFTDPEEEGNRYLFKFRKRGELLPDLEEFDDEFVNGNEIDWWYEIEEDDGTDETEAFVAGDIVDIELFAISEGYNNYIRILINQNGGVGIFDTTPVALKGNCINLTNPANYAHGYFRVTQVVKTNYTFE